LLGKDAPGLSAFTIARLKDIWINEHDRWRRRNLSARHYVFVWADGIHLQARLEEEKQCYSATIWMETRIASFAIVPQRNWAHFLSREMFTQ
jgi:hypothetical protein